MEEKKYEFMLGVNDFGGFDIFEHCLNPSPHQGGVTIVFGVDYSGMRDGDGHPARFEKTKVKTIPESVYDEAMRIYHEAGKNMCALANEAQGLDREIQEGDYLFKEGSFIFIEGLSSLTGKCWIKTFYYDYYGLSIDTDTEIYTTLDEWLDEYEFEDISEFKVIKKEIYEKALSIAKSGILEVKDYLKNILTGI